MVWKIRRNRTDKVKGSRVVRERVRLKSCLRSDLDQSCYSSTTTSKCDLSAMSNKSGDNISLGSRSSGRQGDASSEQQSLGSRSSANSSQASKTSESRTSTLCSQSGGSSRSQSFKAVRFSIVQIRDYERILCDHPSCGSGPPIGIGWSYVDDRVVNVNGYERSRSRRRKNQMEMVVTREDREKLLYDWGVTSEELINSTRALHKAKNQRRQTVRNLDKAQRLEEGFESATRKLKRALLNKRRTREMVKELQQQADLATHALTSLNVLETNEDDQKQFLHRPVIREIEEGCPLLDNLEVNVAVSDFCRSSPADSKVQMPTSSTLNDEGDDGRSCVSGFTLANSTSPSILEMERFYNELELEMFGDEELPSMVGQTLEVPGVEIPEEDRVYRDPPSVSGFQEPRSVTETLSLNPDARYHSQEHSYMHSAQGSGPMPIYQQQRSMLSRSLEQDSQIFIGRQRPYPTDTMPRREPIPVYQQEHSMLSRSLEQDNQIRPTERQCSYHTETMPRRQYPIQGAYHVQDEQIRGVYHGEEDGPMQFHSTNVLLSTSLDSAVVGGYTRPINTMNHQQMLPANIPPRPALEMHQYPRGVPNGAACSGYGTQSQPVHDGPRIQYIPPIHLSPTNWMEEHHSPNLRRTPEPVTISEDEYEQDNQRLMGGEPQYAKSRYDIPRYDPARPVH